MKKILAILLCGVLLLSLGTITVFASEANDVKLARNKADYADYFFDGLTVDYVRNFVCSAFVNEEDEIFDHDTMTQTYVTAAVDPFIEDHFVLSDDMFKQVQKELGYDADRDVYVLPFIGGFGGMIKEREYVSYVKNKNNTYSLYYQTINWLELPTAEYEKIEAEGEYPSEVVYNGKTYENTMDGYLCKDGYKDGGLVHTFDIKNNIARFISTAKYIGSKVPVNKPTTENKPTTDDTTSTPENNDNAQTEETAGVVIENSATVFPENTVVKIEKIAETDTTYQTVVTALKPVAKKFVAYDITATKDNVTVQPDGSVTATFDIPADFDTSKIVIMYVSDDGKVEELSTTVDAATRKATATLTHFSTYVVAEKETANDGITTGDNNDKPNFPWGIVIAVAVIVIVGGAIGGFIIFKKKKNV